MIVARHRLYMPAKHGPFKCSECEYFYSNSDERGTCEQKDLVDVAEDYGLEVKQGKAEVEKNACCDYFENYRM